MRLGEYADVLNLDIEIRRYHNQDNRYCAQLEHCEVKDEPTSSCISSAHGNGRTPEEAMQDYCNQIRGRLLVVNAFDKVERREYRVPMEIKA